MARTNVDGQTLSEMVQGRLTVLIAMSASFTAWDGVTVPLRDANPDKNIPHEYGVREEVHSQMEPYVNAGLYERVEGPVGDGTQRAITYKPVVTISVPEPAALPEPSDPPVDPALDMPVIG